MKSKAEQAFLDTILADPEEVNHRLIFADWLEENGHPDEAEKFRTLPGLASVWSSDWGTDQYGLWCAFTIPTAAHQLSVSVSQKMRWIAPGSFWMGSPEERGQNANEIPRHLVELTQGFWIADTPCTQKMWTAVMGHNPSGFPREQRPVEKVSFADCRAFCEQVRTLVRGLRLTLPTEAQWEFACRAGTESVRYHDDPNAIAWYWDNSAREPHPVARKKPNDWGLYDTLGNVWEWCRDGMREYTSGKVLNPLGPTEELTSRVSRGGYWNSAARGMRAATRYWFAPEDRYHYLGFRCVGLSGKKKHSGAESRR